MFMFLNSKSENEPMAFHNRTDALAALKKI